MLLMDMFVGGFGLAIMQKRRNKIDCGLEKKQSNIRLVCEKRRASYFVASALVLSISKLAGRRREREEREEYLCEAFGLRATTL